MDWHPARQRSQLEPFQVWEVHSCQDARDYNTGRATGRQMLLLRLHQAPSSKTLVLFSLRQCGNLVFAQCLMKPKCLEVSCCFFPCFSLSFTNLDLHVDVKHWAEERDFLVMLQKPGLHSLLPGPCSCYSLWSTAPQGNTCPRHISAYSSLLTDSFVNFMLLFLLYKRVKCH